jgi:hypothetical protein
MTDRGFNTGTPGHALKQGEYAQERIGGQIESMVRTSVNIEEFKMRIREMLYTT